MNIIQQLEAEQAAKIEAKRGAPLPKFEAGDTAARQRHRDGRQPYPRAGL